MSPTRIDTAFTILKNIQKELQEWQKESLNDISDKDVYEIIRLLRIFLEIKGGER